MHVRFAAQAVLVMLVAACAPAGSGKTDSAATKMAAAPDPAAVRGAIDSANARFLAAFLKGDTATMMANYADDADVLMTGSPMARGRADIMKVFNEFMSQGTMKDPKLTTLDVMLGGDLAVETGTYEWTFVPKKGKPMPDKGKYVTVWKKQADGSWKIVRDINNSDMAPKM